MQFDVTVVRPSELTEEDRAAWRGLQAFDPDLGSPFLSPDWPTALEAVGAPAPRVVVVRSDGIGASGFLAVRAGRLTAQPAGAPLCDYQGFVGAPGVPPPSADRLLKALGVARFDFSHLLPADPVFGAGVRGRASSFVCDLSGGWDAYVAGRAETGSKLFKDLARRRRRLEGRVGSLTFTPLSGDAEALKRLIVWKSARHRQTRQTPVLERPWATRLLHHLHGSDGDGFRGGLFTLHAGERLLAVQFHLLGPGVVHAWQIAHDDGPDLEGVSPGLMLFEDVLRWAAVTGRRELDFGPVAYGFKDRFANRTREIGWGFVGRPHPATAFRAGVYAAREAIERAPLGRARAWPGKAMRRLDLWRAL